MNAKRRAILLWVVYFLNLWIVPQFFVVQNADGQLQINRYAYIILQLVTAGYVIWSYRNLLLEQAKKLKDKPLGRDIAIGYAARILLTMVLAMLVPLQQSDNQANVEALLSSTSIPLMIVLTCVVAPLVEELVFREGIIGAFKDKVNPWILSVISLLAFVLLHALSNQGGIDWLAAVFYIPLTLPLIGIYRYYQDNIMASISMHFASNVIAMIFLVIRM